MSDSMTLREMGRVVRPLGVLGELKIAPETDDPGRFQYLKTIYVGADEASALSFEILSVRLQPSKYGITVLALLSGISSRQDAETLNKMRVFASEEDLPPLEDGEFFYSDLIGMTVVLSDGETVGEVEDVIEGSGQDILLIRRDTGAKVMIPLVDEFIVELNLDSRQIIIDPVEGLL